VNQKKYQWAQTGDINAFFGLMLDNIAGLVLLVSLLSINYQFPVKFALAYMVPGTAIGVLVGDFAGLGYAQYLWNDFPCPWPRLQRGHQQRDG